MRSAMLQARVTPEVKQASEYILRQIGLNMTEAMELFLRRVIVDRKLPFEVIALDDATLASATQISVEAAQTTQTIPSTRHSQQRSSKSRHRRE